MTQTVDFKRPHEGIGGKPKDRDFLRQDGIIFGWSESNMRYEPAWWLDPARTDERAERMRAERPLPPGHWTPEPLDP